MPSNGAEKNLKKRGIVADRPQELQAAKDRERLEYVFEASEQNSPSAVTKETAAESLSSGFRGMCFGSIMAIRVDQVIQSRNPSSIDQILQGCPHIYRAKQ